MKYGKKLEGIEDLYVAEHAELEENPHADHLRKVFDVAGIEYGRADYGFYRGRIRRSMKSTPTPICHPEIPIPRQRGWPA